MNLDRSSVSVGSYIYRSAENHKQTIDQTEKEFESKRKRLSVVSQTIIWDFVCVCERVLNMLEHK